MKVLFDTSVLVAAMVDQLPQHERALASFLTHTEEGFESCCCSHALAECYSTLTALPLARRIQPHEAEKLVSENVKGWLKVLNLKARDYTTAIKRVSTLGLRSGVIYDALHLASAEVAGCERLITFNIRDFQRLEPKGLDVVSP